MLEFILDRSNYLLSNYHQPISRKPYPFQEKAFLALDKLKSNNPNGFASMLVLPTGAGKTYTAHSNHVSCTDNGKYCTALLSRKTDSLSNSFTFLSSLLPYYTSPV